MKKFLMIWGMMVAAVSVTVLLGMLVGWLITITTSVAGEFGIWIVLGIVMTFIGALFHYLMEEC